MWESLERTGGGALTIPLQFIERVARSDGVAGILWLLSC
jgi:hypothetical protein